MVVRSRSLASHGEDNLGERFSWRTRSTPLEKTTVSAADVTTVFMTQLLTMKLDVLFFFLLRDLVTASTGRRRIQNDKGDMALVKKKKTFLSHPLMEKTTSQRCCFGYAATATVDVPLCRSIGLLMEKTDLPITYFL